MVTYHIGGFEVYGRNVGRFKSLICFVGAFHDAIAGHLDLWRAGILHRGVNANNILLGPKDGSLAVVDYCMGTRTFQGLHFLRGADDTAPNFIIPTSGMQLDVAELFEEALAAAQEKPQDNAPPAYCHLDDLESFYYAFAWIMFTYKDIGEQKAEVPVFIEGWESLDRKTAYLTKSNYLSIPKLNAAESPISPVFRPLFLLLYFLHNVVHWLCSQKRHEARLGSPVATLCLDAKAHYNTVLRLFDKIMQLLKQSPAVAVSRKRPPGAVQDGEPSECLAEDAPRRTKKIRSSSRVHVRSGGNPDSASASTYDQSQSAQL
ncbi:hypothetical protein AX16_004889 [Volvariella volvacea WC 439]|nr:hypothetical protein AX16_004889 [Volvariella volvacea WC 439]